MTWLLALAKPLLAVLRAVPLGVWVFIAVLAWGGWQRHRAISATEARAQAEQAAAVHEATAAAQAAARELEHALNTKAKEAADAYRAREARLRRDAAAVHTERDRLLDAVAAAGACPAGPGASAPGGVDAAAGLRDVVRQCVGALAQVAAAADASDARLSGLQDYVRAVGLVPAASGAEARP
jgi:hypothetical protein